jgi:hypothetical protein
MDNQIRTSGPSKESLPDIKSTGYSKDPGPYVATVVGHVDSTRMGELEVVIPEFGDSNAPGKPLTAKYCSPFYGKTYGTDVPQAGIPPTSFTSGQSYGMWMVPPDIGAKVLVIFANGDRDKAFWIGCIYDSSSHHMVPGLGRNIGGPTETRATPGAISDSLTKDSVVPVVEFTIGESTAFSPTGLTDTPRYPHEFQTGYLIAQGLDRDPIRGAISSSSMRESPSNVYGISTPGPKVGKEDQAPGFPQIVVARQGGHQFVMDDGDKDGNDQLIRLRTSGGHQILMNDVADKTDKGGKGVLYIASASGLQWLEFSSDGSINMFGIAGFNVRSQGALNFHSDSAVNIHSGGSVKINGDLGVSITSLATCSMSALVSASVRSDGFLTLSALGKVDISSIGPMSVGSIAVTSIGSSSGLLKLNMSLPKPTPVTPTIPNSLPDVTFGGKYWQYVPGALNSICTVVPAHEPWIDPSTKLRPAPSKGAGLATSLGIGVAASAAGGIAGRVFG